MKRTEVLGLEFADVGIVAAVEQGFRLMQEHSGGYILAIDTELLQLARRDARVMRAVRAAELLLPEGNGIILASRILGSRIENRINRFDYAAALMARMSERGMCAYILGDDAETVEAAMEAMTARYPGLVLIGCEEDFFSGEDELIEAVNSAAPDLLLLCFDSPRQELWLYRNREKLNAGLIYGYSDGLKIQSGAQRRAPKRWRDSGFEWLYWIVREPRRIVKALKRAGLLMTALWRRIFM